MPFLLLSHSPAIAAFSADIPAKYFHNGYGLLLTFLQQSFSDISPLPEGCHMIQPAAGAACLWPGKLWNPDNLRLLCLQKTVQFLIDIAVQFFLIPLLPGLILFPSRIVLPVMVIASGLFPNPVRIFQLIFSQPFSISVAFVCCQHGKKSDRHPSLSGVIIMNPDCYFHRHPNLQAFLFWKKLDINLGIILVIICQWYKDSFTLFFCGKIDSMVSVAVGFKRQGKSLCHFCMLSLVVFAYLLTFSTNRR